VRTLSTLSLDQQIASDGATWLDRELTARDRSEIRDGGFGREVNKAITSRGLSDWWKWAWRQRRTATSVFLSSTVATLERLEVEQVGQG
jgi:Protein of unknown function (DUF3363)